MDETFSSKMPDERLPQRPVSDAISEMLANGYTDKGEVPCKRCKQTVRMLESPSGRPGYFNLDGKIHAFRCGEQEPTFQMPPVPDQQAWLDQQEAERTDSAPPPSRGTSGT
jgi:hypothetical protein